MRQTNFVIWRLIAPERIYESGAASTLDSMTCTHSLSAFGKTSEWNQDIQGFPLSRVKSKVDARDHPRRRLNFKPLTNPALDAVSFNNSTNPFQKPSSLLIGWLIHYPVDIGFYNLTVSLLTPGSILLSSADLFLLLIKSLIIKLTFLDC